MKGLGAIERCDHAPPSPAYGCDGERCEVESAFGVRAEVS